MDSLDSLSILLCHAAGLAEASTDLNAVEAWAEVFSVGEQQRVAFLRLLRRRPRLAFLDEATSAMDVETESAMYKLLADTCSSFISVGHRPQLARFHSHVLMWERPGVWACMPQAEPAEVITKL
jgi:vitamin B12/bleomycin/antimicrobial peptide transport system ATP-binding/permease protein